MAFNHAFDARLEHRALGSAAITATAVIGSTNDQRAEQRTRFLTKGTVEAVDIANSDEIYTLVIELSNDDFSSVGEVAAIKDMGDTAVRQSGAPDTAAGDEFEIAWTSEVNGVKYRYWRPKLFVAGTSPSITLGLFTTMDWGR